MIPRRVHRVWLGGPEPEWLRAFAETWRRPGWELRQWSDDDVRELFPLRNQAIFDRAELLVEAGRVGQLRSDLVRYEILHRFGGVYVDADFECLRPIDELVEHTECFAAWEEQDCWIANGLMGAVAGHPFIDSLIEGIPASLEANTGEAPTRISGPQYLTRMHREHGGLDLVIPQALVYPYGYADVPRLGRRIPNDFDTFAVHHWHRQRQARDLLPA